MAAAVSSSHPTQLESYGTHCHFAPCGLADFLPFQCPHCQHSYCSSHRTPDAHACQEYEALDRRAVPCPICGQVLKIDEYMRRHPRVATNSSSSSGKAGAAQEVDIDAVMEEHLASGACSKLNTSNGLLADSQQPGATSAAAGVKKTDRQCKYGRCTNQCWIDLRCDKCGKGFCPTHRDPRHHRCGPAGFGDGPGSSDSRSVSPLPPRCTKTAKAPPPAAKGPASSSSSSKEGATTKLFSKLSVKNDQPKPAASSSAVRSSTTPANAQSSSPSGLAKLKHHLPAGTPSEDKMASKRAAKERESAAMALKKRAEKGLLSEDEKLRYATLQAMQAKNGTAGGKKSDGGKDCCIS